MTRLLPLDQEILGLLAQNPNGLSAVVLLEKLPSSLNQRSLQRHLVRLIDSGKVTRHGKARSTYYKAYLTDRIKPPTEGRKEINLSPEAIKIQSSINQPNETRNKVGYKYSFLEKYIPNETFYLTPNERDYLKALDSQKDGDLPAGTFARKILDRFLIDLSWNSSRLEGNTYSLLETKQLISDGAHDSSKTPTETQMILNHKNAIEFLIESSEDIGFNKYTICNLHAILADNLIENINAYGRVRDIAVGIGNSVYQPIDIPQKLAECFELLLKKASEIKNPFEQSFFSIVQLPYLQAFEDINKRVSRLSANIPFIKHNYSPISFVDVPKKTYIEGLLGVYELNKIDLLKEVFLWAYERSVYRYAEIRHTIGEPDQFRIQYRSAIYELLATIVTNAQTKSIAIKSIRQYANENIPAQDQERFIEQLDTELLSLHEGNFGRYKITPKQFERWLAVW